MMRKIGDQKKINISVSAHVYLNSWLITNIISYVQDQKSQHTKIAMHKNIKLPCIGYYVNMIKLTITC